MESRLLGESKELNCFKAKITSIYFETRDTTEVRILLNWLFLAIKHQGHAAKHMNQPDYEAN
jgi:hypothetical protein